MTDNEMTREELVEWVDHILGTRYTVADEVKYYYGEEPRRAAMSFRTLLKERDEAVARCATLEAACVVKDEALSTLDDELVASEGSIRWEGDGDHRGIIRAALSTTPEVLARVEGYIDTQCVIEDAAGLAQMIQSRPHPMYPEIEPVSFLVIRREGETA